MRRIRCDYPSGNDNGDPPPFDPATGEGGDPNAHQVIIVGQRPEQGTEEPPVDWINAPAAQPGDRPDPDQHRAGRGHSRRLHPWATRHVRLPTGSAEPVRAAKAAVAAPSVIGEIMLRKLAAMHPGV